jgi:hypothetical protein
MHREMGRATGRKELDAILSDADQWVEAWRDWAKFLTLSHNGVQIVEWLGGEQRWVLPDMTFELATREFWVCS